MTDAARAPLPAEPVDPGLPWAYRVQAWAAAVGFALFRLLPIDTASVAGGWLGRHIGPRLGISKRARRNLAAAIPELSAGEVNRIVSAMWDNLGRVTAEYPHLRRIRVFAPGSRVEMRGFEHVDHAVATGQPIIFVSAHLANWEILPVAAHQSGVKMAKIYRAANNPLVDRMINGFRIDPGEMIPKGATGSRRAVAVMRRGGNLALLVDQKLNDGIAVPFFGRPAMTAPAMAVLALRFDCTVLPARVERLGGARFRVTVDPPLELPRTGNREADVAALMERVNRTLEGWIREHPEQWFWLHRRWPD